MSRALSRITGSRCRSTLRLTSSSSSPVSSTLTSPLLRKQQQEQRRLLHEMVRNRKPRGGTSTGGGANTNSGVTKSTNTNNTNNNNRGISKRNFSTQQPRMFNVSAITKMVEDGRASAAAAAGAESEAVPFASVKDIVDRKIMHNITNVLKFTHMTEAQALTLPVILAGKDIIAQAKTGTGKTIAFLLPVFQKMIEDPSAAAMVIAPTRELAHQIAAEGAKLGRGIISERQIQVMVGGESRPNQAAKLRTSKINLLVVTPGRLKDFVQDTEANAILKSVNWQFLVLDEADRLLTPEFKSIIDFCLMAIMGGGSKERMQNMLFSATMPPGVKKAAVDMVRVGRHEFVSTLKEEDVNAHERIPQHVVTLSDDPKSLLPSVTHLLLREREKTKNFKAIAFFPTAKMAQLWYLYFENLGLMKGVELKQIHSRLSQSARNRTALEFKTATTSLLFSSDVTARGMDFPNVTHVFQIGLPQDGEQYIHRLGRTGRAGKGGICYTVLHPWEAKGFGKYSNIRSLFPIMKTEVLSQAEVAKLVEASDTAIRNVDYTTKEKAYQAWLGFYKTFSSKCELKDNTQLVSMANAIAVEAWGMKVVPPIHVQIVGKMGLKGVPGLNIDKTPKAPKIGMKKQVKEMNIDF